MAITLTTGIRFFSGRVEKGKQLGRTIGFPTANLAVSSRLFPRQGVYGVYVYRGSKQYLGVMNVGHRPTINDGEHQTVEVHIFDFTKSIYGETLVIEILFSIRNERKFTSIHALQTQLKKDVTYAKNAFKKIQKNMPSSKSYSLTNQQVTLKF